MPKSIKYILEVDRSNLNILNSEKLIDKINIKCTEKIPLETYINTEILSYTR